MLGYKIGEENVHNIPISDAFNFLMQGYIEKCRNKGEFGVFKEFLNSIGLNRNKVQNSGKKYIITDYCYTGSSLKGAKNPLTEPDLLRYENVETVNIIDTIQDKSLRNYFKRELNNCSYKDISFAEQSYRLKETADHVINPQKADMGKNSSGLNCWITK